MQHEYEGLIRSIFLADETIAERGARFLCVLSLHPGRKLEKNGSQLASFAQRQL